MRTLKSIDELYDEVKDYGLVLTNDAALETALNARIETARLGALAITPRHHAALFASRLLGQQAMSDLRLMAEVSRDTGYSMRHVYSEILNFREIRAHTADVRGNLTTPVSRRIYDSYSSFPTLEKAMGMLDPDDRLVSRYFEPTVGNRRIAVIAPELFDDLDKHCIPMDADIIEMFTDSGEYSIGEIREVGNDRQLADNTADLVDPEHPTDYAIVLSTGDPIADSVRSALYRRGLPFVNAMTVADVPHVRDFLGFLSMSMDFPILRVGQVREMYSRFRGAFPSRIDNYLLSRLEEGGMKDRSRDLRRLMRRIHDGEVTYGEARDLLCTPRERSQITLVLEELDMLERTVDPGTVSEIRFAVENVKELTLNVQRPESEVRGVLIADCKNSVYVDRPVVIYLGMGQEWNVSVAGRRYLDAELETEHNAERLEALLQQGQKRLYCVNSAKNGSAARPCLSFDLICGGAVSSFEDLCDSIVRGGWTPAGQENVLADIRGLRGELGAAELEGSSSGFGGGPFSKSSFNCFAACPRRFMFHELIPGSDSDSSEFGNLIHSFAELCATHPDEVDRIGLDALADMISEEFAGISSPSLERLDRYRILSALKSVRAYIASLDAHPPLDRSILSDEHPNPLMMRLGITETSSWCESRHDMSEHPLYGVLDLRCGNVITDYKTGRGRSPSDIAKSMDWRRLAAHPEFQPLIYLAIVREKFGSSTEFDLFYAMENDVASLEPGFDIRSSVRRIRLYEGDSLDSILVPGSAALQKNLKQELWPYVPQMVDAIRGSGIGDPGRWPTDEGLVKRALGIMKLTDNQTNRRRAVSLLKGISKANGNGMPAGDDALTVPTATLNGFLEYADAAYRRKEEYLHSEFPGEPSEGVDCDRCEFFDLCTRSSDGMPSGDGSDERAQRCPGEAREDAGGLHRGGCGPWHRQDEDHRRPLCQHSAAGGRQTVRRPADDVHQERGRRDGEAHRGPHDRTRERSWFGPLRREVLQTSPCPDLRLVLPLRGLGLSR